MKVSIITIAWNSAETIEATIQSVVGQTYKDIEYIVIDGGSKDDTMALVHKYGDAVAVAISEPDKGIYDAMNKGVQRATGDIIGILNSDDFYADSQVIEEVVQSFINQQCDALYADLVYVDRENTDKIIRYWEAGAYKQGAFVKGWMPPHPTFFVRKEKYQELGIYNTELKSAADYELMLRFMHKYEVKTGYLNRVITKMRVGGQSNVTLKNRIRANKEDRRAWEINGLKPGKLTMIRKPLSKLIQFIKKG